MPKIQLDTRDAPRKSPALFHTINNTSLMISSTSPWWRVTRDKNRARRPW